MLMNVYDFDNTIYDGDSSLEFYLYCIRKKPWLLFCFPFQVIGFCLFKFGVIRKVCFKEIFFCFLRFINSPEKLVISFWNENICKIKKWYKERQKNNDVVVSASPAFLICPICSKIGIKYVLASEVDINTGKFYTENCYGEEKVIRFQKNFGCVTIEEFYSDSLSDVYMAKLAKKSFWVDGNSISVWKI